MVFALPEFSKAMGDDDCTPSIHGSKQIQEWAITQGWKCCDYESLLRGLDLDRTGWGVGGDEWNQLIG